MSCPVREPWEHVPVSSPPPPVLLTTHLIGDVNRSRVLQSLVDHGPSSRADLARLAGVPRATIGAIVQGLVDDGLLEEQEPARSTGRVGKPGRPLWFGREAGRAVAVSFTDEGLRAALVNARGEIVRESTRAVDTSTAGSADLVVAAADATAAVSKGSSPIGVGLAIPGVCDTERAVVIASGQVPGAEGAELVRGLAAETGLPVFVDNDARVQALGEKWFGDGRGVPTFAAVQTGHGLGVGLVLRGALYRGDDGRVGELGHVQVVPDGEPCRCGLTGCWETVATLRWLRAEAARRGLAKTSKLDSAGLAALVARDVDSAADLHAVWAEHLARGLAVLVNLLGVRRFLLHGDAVGGGEPLRAAVEDAVRAASLGYARDELEVGFSSLDADAALLGAAGLVLSETFRLAV
jgi:predicted NBD/HSP70 family sugar kinase